MCKNIHVDMHARFAHMWSVPYCLSGHRLCCLCVAARCAACASLLPRRVGQNTGDSDKDVGIPVSGLLLQAWLLPWRFLSDMQVVSGLCICLASRSRRVALSLGAGVPERRQAKAGHWAAATAHGLRTPLFGAEWCCPWAIQMHTGAQPVAHAASCVGMCSLAVSPSPGKLDWTN
jgi:hypothetical protein